MVRIGVISDTHGMLDPYAVEAFAAEEVVAILHAGDIGAPAIIWELQTVAPVSAVLGNNDHRLPGFDLDLVSRTTIAGVRFLVIHDFLDLGPIPEGIDVVVCGHTHRTRNEWHGSTLVVNPGSATHPRHISERTIGIIDINDAGARITLRIIPLPDPAES